MKSVTFTSSAACLLSLLTLPALSQTAVYDETSRNLTIPAIRLGLTTFTNLVLRLDAIGLVSVDPVPSTISDKCAKTNFHADKYNAIVPGMTLAQVSQLMGCKPNSSKTDRSSLGYTTYQWTDDADTTAYIYTNMAIYFDVDGAKVKVFNIGSTIYPYRSGKGF
jgi:hypothetical protein